MQLINQRIINRSIKVLRCLPFNLLFYKAANLSGIDAENVLKEIEKYTKKNMQCLKETTSIETTFRSLIKIGILRREVDGQGLTSKVRLTPLGRQIIQIIKTQPTYTPNLVQYIRDWFYRRWILR